MPNQQELGTTVAKPSVTEEQILATVQAIVTIVGAIGGALGYVSHDQVLTIGGALAALIGTVWAIWQNRPAGLVHGAAKITYIPPEVQKRVGLKKAVMPKTIEHERKPWSPTSP